jgi:hypothetical protein
MKEYRTSKQKEVKMKHLFLLTYIFFHLPFELVSNSYSHRSSFVDGIDLSKYERRVFSQNGEDGVIESICNILGINNGYYVEFGVETADECNTRFLREQKGWTGLLMDLSYQNLAINLHQERVTAENIVNLFRKYQVPEEFDLLSIDIDFNDFYVWAAICKNYRPRVVVIEYNASHLPSEDKVIIYDPNGGWDGTMYFGGSILSMYELGRRYGYSLVYAESQGVNLFFIRDDVLKNCIYRFKDVNNVESIYRHPKYGLPSNEGGHPRDPHNRQYLSSKELF